MISSRHDQAAVLRTRGCTDASASGSSDTESSGDAEASDARHPGSVTTRRARSWQARRAVARRYPVRRVARRRPTAGAKRPGDDDPSSAASTGGCAGLLIGVAVTVLAVEVVLVWDQLAKAWRSLLSANWWWVLAAAFAALALDAQLRPDPAHPAEVRGRRTSSSGVRRPRSTRATHCRRRCRAARCSRRRSSIGSNGIWGASPMVASWQLVMSGVLQVVGLALLGLAGAFLLGASKNPLSLIFTLGGFVALLVLAQTVAVEPAADRRHRGAGAVVGQLVARQACRHRSGQVARDARAARVGQPEPARARHRVQLVAVQLGRRRRLPGVRRLRRGRQAVAGRV